ncbi:hypothetical protein ACLK1T_11565 [Escherichia coli]
MKGEQFDRLSLLNDIYEFISKCWQNWRNGSSSGYRLMNRAGTGTTTGVARDAYKPAYDALPRQVKLLLTTYLKA